MTYGELVERMAKFHSRPSLGNLLREADPECADAFNTFWEMWKGGMERANAPAVGESISFFERDIFERVARILVGMSTEERSAELQHMSSGRKALVAKLGGFDL